MMPDSIRCRPLRCAERSLERRRFKAGVAPCAVPRHGKARTCIKCIPKASLHSLEEVSLKQNRLKAIPGPRALWWPASDLHCQVFLDKDSPTPPGSFLALLQRIDRLLLLLSSDGLEQHGAGRGALLLVQRPGAGHLPPAGGETKLPWLLSFLRPWLDKDVVAGLGVSAQAAGVLGAANVDTFCDPVPAKWVVSNGTSAWRRRKGYAYISNVVTCKGARRQGVARLLVAESVRLAEDWGAQTVGLHCSLQNEAAMKLYHSFGFRKATLEPAWLPYLLGRADDRCIFMIKRLRLRSKC